MEEAGISDLLRSERMGHEVPGMRGVYGHVSPAMRADLKAMLQERWDMSCPYASAAIGSLDRPPSTLRPSGAATKIGSQNWTPPLPEWGQTDQDRSTWPIRERLLLQVVAGRLHLLAYWVTSGKTRAPGRHCCQNTVMPQCRVTPADQPRHKARVHVGHPPIAGDQPGCWPSPPAAATGPADVPHGTGSNSQWGLDTNSNV